MTRFDLASKAHPSYIFAGDVTLPEGFTDSSYHHDEGPSIRHGSGMCAVSFNYPSTNPHISPYMVSTTLDQRGIDSGEARHYWYKCMTWPEVLEAIDTWRKRTGHEVARHTPGPWKVTLQAEYEVCIGCDEPIDNNGYIWAVQGNGNDDGYVQNPAYANNESNAQLIASAPELLEALEEVANDIESYCDDWNSSSPTDVTVVLPILRAAIAKAKGGA